MPEPTVLGVDCGGTRTRAILAPASGHQLGTGAGAASNPRDVGYGTLVSEVQLAVWAAFKAAGVRPGPVAAAHLGVAGVATQAERQEVRKALTAIGLAPGASIGVSHDLRIAQAGAHAGGPGVVLCVGTGACCYGRDADGREWRAGGWGSPVDDGGGATDLGLRAIAAVLREADGRGPRTPLSGAVLTAARCAEVRQLLAFAAGEGWRTRVAALGPVVTEAAAGGDQTALTILEAGAGALGEMTAAVLSRLEPGLPLALVGGAVAAPGLYDTAIRRAVTQRSPGAVILAPRASPAWGAVLLARERLAVTR